MLRINIIFLFVCVFLHGAISQITPTKTAWTEDFEYTTDCNEAVPGTIYHLPPQVHNPHTGSRHLYLNFVNDLSAMTVAYEKQFTGLCDHEQVYNLSLWVNATWGAPYSVTFRIYDAATLVVDDEVASSSVGTFWYNYTTSFSSSTGDITFQLLNTWTNTGVGGYDVGLDDITLTSNNAYVANDATDEFDISFCDHNQVNLFQEYIYFAGLDGVWAGPSTLSNNIYSTSEHLEGDYFYNLLKADYCPDTAYLFQIKNNAKELNLGNDTLICEDFQMVLDASDEFDVYTWSNGSSNSSVEINEPGEYSVETQILGDSDPIYGTSLIINGDFEQGDVGFSTDYILGTGGTWGLLSDPGTYAVNTNPNNVHNNFYSCTDHTTSFGEMLIVNGADVANEKVWCQTVTVDPNKNYDFSAWVMSVENTSNPAELQFTINGVPIGSVFSPSSTSCDWGSFSEVWSSGSNTTAEICITNQNTTGGGNDFALDDISFRPISFAAECTYSDVIVVESICAPIIEFPNVFSPNGSVGDNDIFLPKMFEFVGEHTFTVFNRWGKEVFSTDDIVSGWNGTSDGNPISAGTYYYIFQYQDENNESYAPLKGHITVF